VARLFLAVKATRRKSSPKRRRLALPEIPWARVISFFAVVGLAAGLFYYYGDIEAVHRAAARLNGFVAFALLTVLPLLGFPASVLHIAAGIRFGGPLGLALVALSILLQLLASYAIVHFWRARLDRLRFLRRVRERLPEGAHPSVCVLAVLLPGAPFAAINYSLPLIGVPLRTYLLCCLPIHVLRSTVTVLLGHQSAHLTAPRLAVLGAYGLLVFAASWWTYRKVRSKLGGPPPAAGGRRQPA
jgi:uncharacterized membrane protein YdjX (TVP38/TMEM64 family)